MVSEELIALLLSNEAKRRELERTQHAIHGNLSETVLGTVATDRIRAQNQVSLDEIRDMISKLREFQGKVGATLIWGAMGVSWENLSIKINGIKDRLEIDKQGYEQAIASKDQTLLTEKAFAYQQTLLALNTAIDCGIHYLQIQNDTIEEGKKFLSPLLSKVEEYVGAFTTNLQTLSGTVSTPAHINLKAEIDSLSTKDENDYTVKQGAEFWRGVKNYFRNSDRAAEITFLKNVSNCPECTDEIRLHAMSLVHDKIAIQEMGHNSLLREKLSIVIDRAAVQIQKDHESNLQTFCESHHIDIPNKLNDYLEANAERYTSSALKNA